MFRIGVFDSGLGGLTIVKSLQSVLKDASVYYIADTKHAPYGEKSPKEIEAYALAITHYLYTNYTIDALVVACNTATAFAIEALRKMYPELIIIGTEPGLKPAMQQTKSGNIGILATEATLKGEKYQTLLRRLSAHCEGVTVYEQACVGLVEKIEEGKLQDRTTLTMLEKWLTPMKKGEVDTIVLGCTHYPLVAQQIVSLMPKSITLIHTGDAIARRLESLRNTPSTTENRLQVSLFTTSMLNLSMVEMILGNPYDVKVVEVSHV
jgi:glutamate racemase